MKNIFQALVLIVLSIMSSTTLSAIVDSNWASPFGIFKRANNAATCMAFDKLGNTYIGGYFDSIGGISAKHIAKWDGSAWSALGSGTNDIVNAIAIDTAGNIYAGGKFIVAGKIVANYIAKWDGVTWSAVGNGMDSLVTTLACDSFGNLYAGGKFTKVDDSVAAKKIAKWDGKKWSALDYFSYAQTEINQVVIDRSGNLYACGAFNASVWSGNHYITKSVAKWNGVSWYYPPAISEISSKCIVVDNSGNVYVNGSQSFGFLLYKWDGSTWHNYFSTVAVEYRNPKEGCYVTSLAIDKFGSVYMSGIFNAYNAVGGVAYNIAKWDGSILSALGSGIGGLTNGLSLWLTIDSRRGNLYAMGVFDSAGAKLATTFCKPNAIAMCRLEEPTIPIISFPSNYSKNKALNQISILYSNSSYISYTISVASNVIVYVYNMQGKRLKTICNSYQQAGSYQIPSGMSNLSKGQYLMEFKAGNFNCRKKVINF